MLPGDLLPAASEPRRDLSLSLEKPVAAAEEEEGALGVPGVIAPVAAGKIAIGAVDVGGAADRGGRVRAGAAGCRVGVGGAALLVRLPILL